MLYVSIFLPESVIGGSLRRTVHYAQYWCKTRREMEGKLD